MDPNLVCCFLRLGFCGAYGLRGNLLNRHNHNRRTATSHKGGNAACMTREDHGRSNRSCFRCASQTCDVAGCRPVVFMAPRLDPKGASTRVPRLDVEPVASRCSFWVLPEKVQQSQAISQAPSCAACCPKATSVNEDTAMHHKLFVGFFVRCLHVCQQIVQRLPANGAPPLHRDTRARARPISVQELQQEEVDASDWKHASCCTYSCKHGRGTREELHG